jgi:hypothetical protein
MDVGDRIRVQLTSLDVQRGSSISEESFHHSTEIDTLAAVFKLSKGEFL